MNPCATPPREPMPLMIPPAPITTGILTLTSAANRFLDMGREQGVEKPTAPSTPAGDFGIGPGQLVEMSKDHNIASLQQYRGVTGVGVNTEWGLLMASISEDNGEETPLQVRLNGVATFIGSIGLAVAAFVLVILLVQEIIRSFTPRKT